VYLIHILTNIEQEFPGDINIKINISNNKLDDNKSFYCKTSIDEIEIMQKFKDKVNKLKSVWDLKLTRYQLRVRSHKTNEYDSKIMSFHSKDDFDNVYDAIKKRFDDIIQNDKENKIIFVDEKDSVKTHTVTLRKNKCISKSFSITLSNYSSTEILEMI